MSEMQSGLLYHLKAQDYLELILTHTSSHKRFHFMYTKFNKHVLTLFITH